MAANFALAEATDTLDPEETSMDVEVVANQWWWEVRYPGSNACRKIMSTDCRMSSGSKPETTSGRP